MVVAEGAGWSGMGWQPWTDLDGIRARLDAGADPDSGEGFDPPPLHLAAQEGSPEVVAELAGRVDDVDAQDEGRSALWRAVYAGRPDNARALVAAGADPWRPMMAGWSPGRLSLAGPTLDLFAPPAGGIGLSGAETAAAAEARRLTAALGELRDLYDDGMGLACVAGISAAEAARRLEATPVEDTGPGSFPDDLSSYEVLYIVGAADVPGGCVISQPWGYVPSMPEVTDPLSAGTVCYGLYDNPKSGHQGSISRDGVTEDRDLYPGGEPSADDSADEILASYLYRDHAVAYSCAYAGLRLTDARAITSPDVWLRLPSHHYWR